MYLDMYTPTWAGLLTFQGVCVVILAVALYLRAKLRGGKSDASAT